MTSNPLIWLMIIPIISSVLVYVIGRIIAPHDNETANRSVWVCVFCIAMTFIPFILTAKEFFANGSVTLNIAQMSLKFDGISMVICMSVLILGLAVAIFSSNYMENEEGEEKFYGLLMLLIASILCLSCSTDLFNIYICFELMALSTYSLVSFYRNQAKAMEAGMKYIVQSAAGSALIVLSIAAIFGSTGDVSLEAVKAAAVPTPILIAAGAGLIIGYGIKCAFVPMHKWLPDAHSMAPTGVSAMLSGIVIEAALIALLRSLGAIHVASKAFGYVFLVFGIINIIYGNIAALNQKMIKRIFAYSSIAHMGYITVGVGFALTFVESAEAANGVFFHIFNHAMMKGLAFLSIGVLTYNLKLRKGDHEPLVVDDINGAAQKFPFVALLMSIAVLALGSLPPFAGFMSKWQIMSSGAQASTHWGWILAIIAASGGLLSLGYYAPLVNHMYRHEESECVKAASTKTPIAMMVSLIILVIFVLALGFAPNLISNITQGAADALFAAFS